MKETNGFGIASLVLGIAGMAFSCLIVGMIPACVGIILGIAGLCQKDKPKGMAVAGVMCSLIGLIITVMVIAIWSDNSQGKNTKIVAGTEEIHIEKAEATEDVEENDEITVGSYFEVNGLKITINEANTDFQDYDNEYGWNTPEDGMKYVMVSFTFENTGDSDAYVSIYDFQCYADNTACEQVYSLDDSDFININLSNGRNVSFKTYYAVPVESEFIELEYETNLWTGDKAIIKIQ